MDRIAGGKGRGKDVADFACVRYLCLWYMCLPVSYMFGAGRFCPHPLTPKGPDLATTLTLLLMYFTSTCLFLVSQ